MLYAILGFVAAALALIAIAAWALSTVIAPQVHERQAPSEAETKRNRRNALRIV